MADYEFRYELAQTPVGRNDGSGMISHEIHPVARVQGSNDDFVRIGLNKDILIPAEEVKVVMDMPHSSGSQKTAKNNAYKDALASNLNTHAEPISGFTKEELEKRLDNNDSASLEAGRVNDYIVTTLGQSYPVQFSI